MTGVDRSAALDCEDAPECPPGPASTLVSASRLARLAWRFRRRRRAGGRRRRRAVASGSAGPPSGLGLGGLAPVVGTALGVVADLHDGSDVQKWLWRRFPARESRCRIWSPLEASRGAVPATSPLGCPAIRRVVLPGGVEPAGRQHRSLLVDDLDGHRLLVRVHTHDHTGSSSNPHRSEPGATARTTSWTPATSAFAGVALAFIGGLFIAQAGGSDRETFLSIGFLLGSIGLLGIVIGGVALGFQMARD